MDFGFTAEQDQLRAQVRRFLDSECPLERVRALAKSEQPLDRTLWKKTAELGWHALVVPESHGGLGLSWEDVVVVAEETGRSLFPSPFIATAVAARLITKLGSDAQKDRWLAAIAAGESTAAIAVTEENDVPHEAGVEMKARSDGGSVVLSGIKMFVADGQGADLLLVVAREGEALSVFAVPGDTAGITREPLQLVDATHRAARVTFERVVVDASARLGVAGKAAAAVRDALDAQTVALAAEMVGSAQSALDLAVEYAKVRKQFGQPIGRFQGVKHKLAEIHVAIESARSLTYYASWAVDNAADAATHVSMARVCAGEAVDRAGEECVQTHGAIGFTAECDAQLFYKRGRFSRNLGAAPSWYNERILTSQGL
jgi:alkylation response protein AidB-like acyl-CoA dehydrogenase